MNLYSLAQDVAQIAGYSITASDAQSVAAKARAYRRINAIRNDIGSRFSGKWLGQYREGWLPLVPVYNTGTVALTINSRTVTGSGTSWDSTMVGRKFLGPNLEYYKISAVASTTSLTLSEPYQGASVTSGGSYSIWKDEYVLYPDAYSVIDFINYTDPAQMAEESSKHGRLITPRPQYSDIPESYMVIGRKGNVGTYSTGTVSGAASAYTLTGAGTSWLGNLYPGYAITVGSYTYHVDTVDSDTQVTLRQLIVTTIAALTSYTAKGSNGLIVRFLYPSNQTVVNYSYYAKTYPLVNDSDEDWLLELYPQVVENGILRWDYLDKNDPVRSQIAAQLYENDIHNSHVSDAAQFGGVSSVGLDIPDSARE